jgi:hypothetical protein
MPYITPGRRQDLGLMLNPAVEANAGDLTYLFYRLALDSLPPGYSYADLHRVIGAMEAAKLEFYRRIVAPYEDVKIQENGDVRIVDS